MDKTEEESRQITEEESQKVKEYEDIIIAQGKMMDYALKLMLG